MQTRSFIAASGALASSLAAPTLQAQDWPAAPVRILVGFPPGGGTDALARVVAKSSRRCGASRSSSRTRRVLPG